MSARKYYVMECDDEDSVSIVWDEDMACEESVSVGDEAIFFYNSKQFVGTVRLISDDYDECLAKEKEVLDQRSEAARKRKERSFHRERPRDAALKNRENLIQAGVLPGPSKRSKVSKTGKKSDKRSLKEKAADKISKEIEGQMKKRKNTIYSSDDDEKSTQTSSALKKKEISVNLFGSDSDGDHIDVSGNPLDDTLKLNSDSEEDGAPSPKKVNPRAVGKDSPPKRTFQGASTSQGSSPKRTFHRASTSKGTSPKRTFKRASSSENAKRSPAKLSPAKLSPAKRLLAKAKTSKPAGVGNLLARMKYMRNHTHLYQGDMYLCSGREEEDVQLEGGIYCKEAIMRWAQEGTTASMVARRLLEGVFTNEALQRCSLTALPPRGKGKAFYRDGLGEIKKMLDPKAVSAIIKFALEMQKSRGWKPRKDETYLRAKISGRLCEIANEGKLNAELRT